MSARSAAAPAEQGRPGTPTGAPALYDCVVTHRRGRPRHVVRQRLRLAYLDADRPERATARRLGWSTRPAPVWFRRADYLNGGSGGLGTGVRDLVEERLGRRPTGPVTVLTQLRTMGYLFNPLTAYYAFDADGQTLAAVVLEVTNTPWRERSWYVIDGAEASAGRSSFDKDFHVSPFLPMELRYQLRAPAPGARLALSLTLTDQSNGVDPPVLAVTLTGTRAEISSPHRPLSAIRLASQTLGVTVGIHLHAVVLKARGARFHRHPSRSSAP